jgi:hypothetical protein
MVPVAALAQDCRPDSIPASTPTSRFTDNHDGTVTDTATGLTWKRCAEGLTWDGSSCTGDEASFTWQEALQQAGSVNSAGGYAGHADWRLPNIKELRSIVERQCLGPAINLSVFPGASASHFWSGSPIAGFSLYAWGVLFSYGYDDWNYRDGALAVRLARGGQ